RIAGFAYSIEADFQILRVSREWSIDGYLAGAGRLLDSRYGHREAWREYLERHRHELRVRQTAHPEVYLAVRLARPEGSVVDQVGRAAASARRDPAGALRRFLGLSDPRGMSQRRLEALLADEDKAFRRVYDYFDC